MHIRPQSFQNLHDSRIGRFVVAVGNKRDFRRACRQKRRARIHKPSVMILDEATANIDTETEILIQDSLEKMAKIGTMLIVAHRLSTIQHADRIYVLSHGQILESGSHNELLAARGRYYQLYTLQYHKEQSEKNG